MRHHAPCPILGAVILSERGKSKDLLLVMVAIGWETTIPTGHASPNYDCPPSIESTTFEATAPAETL
jgi:hypothetical protein